MVGAAFPAGKDDEAFVPPSAAPGGEVATGGLGVGGATIFAGAEGVVGVAVCAGSAEAFAAGAGGGFTAGPVVEGCAGEDFNASGEAGASEPPEAPGGDEGGLADGVTAVFTGTDKAGDALSAGAGEGFPAGEGAEGERTAGEGAGLEAVPGGAVGALLAVPAVGFTGGAAGLAVMGGLAGVAAGLGTEVFFGVEAAAAFVDAGRADVLRAAGTVADLDVAGRLAAVFAEEGAAFATSDVADFAACAAHASIKGTAAHIDATTPITQAFRSAIR